MRVLVGCEFSGVVRDAFIAKGHDAVSCDLLPCDRPGPHIQEDLLTVLDGGWDLMIAHPPCTYLSSAGLHYCKGNPERQCKREEAKYFVQKLYSAPIPKICIENPVGHLSTAWQAPTQIIRMNEFGHADAIKPTCLWLKNLPQLRSTNVLPPRRSTSEKGVSEWYARTKDPRKRSITFQGVADAMAEQWG